MECSFFSWPSRRSASEKGRKTPEVLWTWKQYSGWKFSDIFSMFFLCFPTGGHRKNVGKISENFRSEYYVRLWVFPMLSRWLLQVRCPRNHQPEGILGLWDIFHNLRNKSGPKLSTQTIEYTSCRQVSTKRNSESNDWDSVIKFERIHRNSNSSLSLYLWLIKNPSDAWSCFFVLCISKYAPTAIIIISTKSNSTVPQCLLNPFLVSHNHIFLKPRIGIKKALA